MTFINTLNVNVIVQRSVPAEEANNLANALGVQLAIAVEHAFKERALELRMFGWRPESGQAAIGELNVNLVVGPQEESGGP